MSYTISNDSSSYESVFVTMGEMINSTFQQGNDTWLRYTILHIRMCFLPIIVAGTVTNILNFLVLSRKEMRCLSTSVYLFALAVADLGVMYFELFRIWFEWMDLVDPTYYFTDTYCKIANYTNGITRDFSNWLIAALTLERVVMVACPYKAKNFCTVTRAKWMTLALLMAICIPHIHCLIYSKSQMRIWWVCWEDPDSVAASVFAAVVEFLVGYIVILVVFILNIILVVLIYKNKLPCLALHPASGKRASYNRRLTRTLLFVAIVFLICETPRMIMAFITRFLARTPERRIILNVSYVISGMNHACNFFIYIFASPRYRQLLLEILPRFLHRHTKVECSHGPEDGASQPIPLDYNRPTPLDDEEAT